MNDIVVAAVRRQLKIKTTDLGSPSIANLKPTKPTDIANDETRLGFKLPPLMRRLYTEIGNGGFGPGYGLIGLTNGVPDDMGSTSLVVYERFMGARTVEPGLKWPYGLLPICHWGCAILSCVDCTDANFRMRIFDPNAQQSDDWSDCYFEESDSFESWISDWAEGADLWDLMYGEKGRIAETLSKRFGMS